MCIFQYQDNRPAKSYSEMRDNQDDERRYNKNYENNPYHSQHQQSRQGYDREKEFPELSRDYPQQRG